MCGTSLLWRLAAIATILLGNLSTTVLAADDIATSQTSQGQPIIELGTCGLETASRCISVERDMRFIDIEVSSELVTLLAVVVVNRCVTDKDRTCTFQRDNRPRILRLDRPLMLI